MTLLVVYVGIALTFSFLCSVLEAVLLSISPAYLAQTEQAKPALGKRMRALKTNVDRPLAAILSLNTIAHTVGAAGAGAQAQFLWGSDILAIASAVLTLLILVFSEIIPKTLGAVYWRVLAPFATRALEVLVISLYPLVLLSELITKGLSRGKHGGTLDRAEIAALTRAGAEQGLFNESESRILKSLFVFSSVRARDVMTPRTVLFSLQRDRTVGEVIDLESLGRFSRIPIWGKNDDDVSGYVLKDSLLVAAASDELSRPLTDFHREIQVVPDWTPLPEVLQRLLETKEHIVLAINEFGGASGVVTLEDVVETLLGIEIVDEVDSATDMRALARQRWVQRARDRGLSSEDIDAVREQKAAASLRPPAMKPRD